MVKGLAVFKEHFAAFQDCYVLIGGSACDIQMEEAGLDFRATKDLDLVLCAEALNEGFVAAFWDFIEKGGYQQREKSEGEKEFFRFIKPTNNEYPAQLELFSRALEKLPIAEGVKLTPIPVEGEADSLSAILLDDDYYGCLQQGADIVDGVRVLKPAYLLVFKAKAYLDLTARKDAGEAVDSRDIKKHKLDVCRLFQLLPTDLQLTLPIAVKNDVENFVQNVRDDLPDLKSIGIKNLSAEALLENISKIYQLGEAS
ncbi:MAG: hypothetical protein WCY88_02620 [Spongiibacteraceae bacterium]